jgi:hypothetical protein
MTTVLAALDASPAARPVLDAALALAELLGAGVEAVYVAETPSETPMLLAARAGVPLRLLEPPVRSAVLAALARPEVVGAVLGARSTPVGRRPAGHTALGVLERAGKPILIVAPDARVGSPPRFRRVLVPLEGTRQSSGPIMERLCPLVATSVEPDLELVVLHVFTPASMPKVLDHPGRDMELLGGEFAARYCPQATRVELRAGAVGAQVEEVCRADEADVVVLSWSQDLSEGHAAVIRDVLERATVPVLLLPLDAHAVLDLDGAVAGEPMADPHPVAGTAP